MHTAVIRGAEILMVRHVHDGRDYWTLPGGGIEEGEEPRQAAIREVKEETGIEVGDVRQLFTDTTDTCFIAHLAHGVEPILGSDPELDGEMQVIKEVRWFTLVEKRDDLHVSKVLKHLDADS